NLGVSFYNVPGSRRSTGRRPVIHKRRLEASATIILVQGGSFRSISFLGVRTFLLAFVLGEYASAGRRFHRPRHGDGCLTYLVRLVLLELARCGRPIVRYGCVGGTPGQGLCLPGES